VLKLIPNLWTSKFTALVVPGPINIKASFSLPPHILLIYSLESSLSLEVNAPV
jgi:hypothetical protein